jgi:hypothetical protein
VEVLVIDAANVIGSRPDGWWRDRAGAAERLADQVRAAALPYDEVVLVLEGAARVGRDRGRDGGLTTVHASGSGDDTIVDTVRVLVAGGREVVVVTADRELRSRVGVLGAAALGPSWLLTRLDPD